MVVSVKNDVIDNDVAPSHRHRRMDLISKYQNIEVLMGVPPKHLSGFIEIIDYILSSFLITHPVEMFWPDFMLRRRAILSLTALKGPLRIK